MGIVYYIIIIVVFIFIFLGIAWGSGKRMFHNRDFCKKYLDNPKISDSDFYNNELFKINNIPKDYIIKKRNWLCDEILDYPIDRIHPNMIFDEIPSILSLFNDSDLELYSHIKICGGNPKIFLKGKTLAQVIVDLYNLEIHLPDELSEKIRKYGIVLPERLPKKDDSR